MMRFFKIGFRVVFIGFLIFTSWLMLRLSLPYTALKPNIDFLQTKQFIYHIAHWRYSFYIHVFTSIFVLVAGLFQFSSYIIRKLPLLHRISGYVYVIVVLFISGPASFIMALYANGGIPARISFTLLSIGWISFTAIAFQRVYKKRFIQHGNWMLRSYALTLSAITLRSYAFLFALLEIEMRPVHIYITIAWLSWVPNLIVAEILIRNGFIKTLLKNKAVLWNKKPIGSL